MTTDITKLAQMKGQKVEAPYYLAECTECGKMYPSSQLIESRNYMDGDADCYCPHCNATDPDIADCGSEGVTAWNYQQARIDALVEALEKAQQQIIALQQRHEVDPRTHEIIDLKERITELESEVEKWKQESESWEQVAEKQLATAIALESRTVKLPKFKMLEDYLSEVAVEERKAILLGVKMEFHRALNAEGIRWEAE